MGSKDTKTKAFVRNNMRFADVCNYYLYGGKKVIRPEHLQERDAAEIANISGKYNKTLSMQKFRDLLKGAVLKESDKALYMLIGIENQSDIHYAIYWGAGKWDGPRSLHEMFDTEDETILKYAQDYKVNLIIPDEIEDFGVFATDMGYTLDCIKHSGSKENLMGFFEKNEELHYWQREIK